MSSSLAGTFSEGGSVHCFFIGGSGVVVEPEPSIDPGGGLAPAAGKKTQISCRVNSNSCLVDVKHAV